MLTHYANQPIPRRHRHERRRRFCRSRLAAERAGVRRGRDHDEGLAQDCIAQAQDACCGPSAIMDARAVAHTIGIPHYVVDETLDFEKEVIDYFTRNIAWAGRPTRASSATSESNSATSGTKARALGAEYIATGHYAPLSATRRESVPCTKGSDARKDQSYFLFSLSQEQLRVR